MDGRGLGKLSLAVASQDVYGCSGDEVPLCAQRDLVRALALVRDDAVQGRFRGGCGWGYRHADLEPDGEREANDVETGTDVRGGRGDSCIAGSVCEVLVGWERKGRVSNWIGDVWWDGLMVVVIVAEGGDRARGFRVLRCELRL